MSKYTSYAAQRRAALQNHNCDNTKCDSPDGEVRWLPTGGNSNALLCRSCFDHEMEFRRNRNLNLDPDCRFDLPAWETLKVYV